MLVIRSLILWVTTDCNLFCRYCYARGGERSEYMSPQVARRAIDLVSQSGQPFKIQFSGGEPVLNLELIADIVDYCADLSVRFQIQTNATLVTPSLAAHLRELDVAVGVSLDGIPEVNDRLRVFPDGSGSSGAAISGIQSFAEIGTTVGMTCVLTRENAVELPQLVTLAAYLGNVYGISIDILRPVGRAVDENLAHAHPAQAARAVRQAAQQADALAAIGGTLIRFREVERMRYWLQNPRSPNGYCHFSHAHTMMVTPAGEVYPCASLAGLPSFHLGNVLDPHFAEGLPESLLHSRDLIPLSPQCRQCPQKPYCRGGCPARAYTTRQCPPEVKSLECQVRKTYLCLAGDQR